MLVQILILVFGFVILIKGADVFVDGASNLARNFRLSKMFVGLTIVAFGTSAPELAVSIKSMISGSGEIVLGNVIDKTSYYVFYLIVACIEILALIFFIIIYRNDDYRSMPNKKRKKKVEKIEEVKEETEQKNEDVTNEELTPQTV